MTQYSAVVDGHTIEKFETLEPLTMAERKRAAALIATQHHLTIEQVMIYETRHLCEIP